MYDNIGEKIKGLAKAVFIVEAIGAVIAGIALLATYDDFILEGLLTLFCGPIFAWVSSWVLYAFGELVEDVHAVRNNVKNSTIEKNTENIALEEQTTTSKPTALKSNEVHEVEKKQYVNNAMNMRTNSTVPYWCGKCGYDGPYDGNCPKCNSSLKKYNV